MKKKRLLQFVFFVLVMITHIVTADTGKFLTFSWTPNVEPVSGYKIHFGTSSRGYTSVADVGLPEAVNGSIIYTLDVSNEPSGTLYYFAATAYNETKESDYSVEVLAHIPGEGQSKIVYMGPPK